MAKKGNNRAQRRNKKNDKYEEEFDLDLKNKIYVALGIIAFFLVFYLLTVYITNKNSTKTKSDDTGNEVNISYDNILLGRSFDMSDGEYFVVYYDKSNEELAKDISDIITTYETDKGDLTVYIVDMHDALNSSYSADISNTHPNSVNELQINGPTLIKFDNHEVVDYIEGIDGIRDYLS